MKKILWTCIGLGLLTTITMQAVAQERGETTGVVVAKTNVVKATVQAIDHKKREVTLRDAKGDEYNMKISQDVKNLDQVKKGDEIITGYYQSTAISVSKPGEKPAEPAQAQAVIVGEKGQKPGGLAVQTTQKIATVEEIDHSTREIKLKDSDGNTVKIKVGDRVKGLEDVKKGDRIVATYTEALAVSVVKPED
jgi:hypothetical protein